MSMDPRNIFEHEPKSRKYSFVGYKTKELMCYGHEDNKTCIYVVMLYSMKMCSIEIGASMLNLCVELNLHGY